MAEFVLSPNLPLAAGTVIIGQKYADLLEKPLQNLNIHPLFVPDNPDVDARLSGHADLSVFHAGGERLWLAPYLRETDFQKRCKSSARTQYMQTSPNARHIPMMRS